MLVRLSVAMFRVGLAARFSLLVVDEGVARWPGSISSSGATSSATLIAASSALLIVLTSAFTVSPSLYSHLIATVRSSRPVSVLAGTCPSTAEGAVHSPQLLSHPQGRTCSWM
jgi:hypothetical protein